MAKQRNRPLTATLVERGKPGIYGDGRGGFGLYLRVKRTANGRTSRYFAQRVRIAGRVNNLGIGNYPLVTLAEARKIALKNRRMILRGEDPREPGIPTFAELAETVIAFHAPTTKNPKRTVTSWRTELGYAFPTIGEKPVDRITSADVLRVLTPIWNAKRATAKRVKAKIRKVLAQAIVKGFRPEGTNPVGAVVDDALPKNGQRTKHHKAVPHQKVPDAFRKLKKAGNRSDMLALRFLILTACRVKEATEATWNEIDEEARLWIIPARRTKTDREHRVPLSPAALAVLAQTRRNSLKGSDLVFPSPRGKLTSSTNIWRALKRLQIDGTAHGFRQSFANWCSETGVSREVADAALAHTVSGVQGAYFTSDLLARRRQVFQAWAEHVTS